MLIAIMMALIITYFGFHPSDKVKGFGGDPAVKLVTMCS
jgi:hypothetical protein